ncbi:BamA/TamA family outer membrane protein [Cyanobium sp. FGCU-52]|nr:BamA/TamA family outer membrane protein [Cyanobium sp. FGCU52]
MAGARRRTPHSRPHACLGAAAALPLMGAFLLVSGEARAEDRSALAVTPPPPVEQAGGERPVATAVDTTALEAAASASLEPIAQADPATTDTAPAQPESAAPAAESAPPAPEATPPAGAGNPDPFSAPGGPQVAPATPSPQGAPTPDAPAAPPPAANEPRVRISEVVVEGLDGHPEKERLELAAYAAMKVTPGGETTRSELRNDLTAVYATGWFSDVRIQPVDGPLGVRLKVQVVPNPVLTKVSLDPPDAKVPPEVVQDTFAGDYGRTLNLNTLQTRLQELQKWYADQGYSLARVTGPNRVSPEGDVLVSVRQGTVEGVEVQFLNKEGSATNDKGQPIRGKTRPWVITREISLKPGQIFNRRNLEEDLKRLYGTGLFSDVKVTLRPEPADPGKVTIVLGIVEQSTGSLSGGLGYSQSQGVFGQVQVQDSNLLGRAWDVATSFTYGQFGGLADITFTDPWIKGDPYRTAFRVKAFVSRDVPQIFQSQDNGNIYTVSEFYEAPGTSVAYNINSNDNPLNKSFGSVEEAQGKDDSISWFDYTGNSVVIQRIGGNIQFVRPLNGGNPFKRAPWSVVVGLSAQQVTPMDFSGDSQLYGVATNDFSNNGGRVPNDSIICLSYNCATNNQLVGVRIAASMNTLDDPRNPTRGNFLTLGTEQFISVGPDSPTFNRLRGSFSHYIPVRWLKFYKGCRPKAGETEDCKQALAFQVSAGTNIGSLPPYEAFCVGGGNSVRGFYDCDMGVGRSFGEATIEYRFPLFSIVSGELFVDGGTTFGSQKDVPGNPGELLDKPGSGFSVGTGLIVTTPVGPLRLEVASRDFSGDWRFNLGVGWKF